MIRAGYLTLCGVPALKKKKVFLIMSIFALFLDNSEEQRMLFAFRIKNHGPVGDEEGQNGHWVGF